MGPVPKTMKKSKPSTRKRARLTTPLLSRGSRISELCKTPEPKRVEAKSKSAEFLNKLASKTVDANDYPQPSSGYGACDSGHVNESPPVRDSRKQQRAKARTPRQKVGTAESQKDPEELLKVDGKFVYSRTGNPLDLGPERDLLASNPVEFLRLYIYTEPEQLRFRRDPNLLLEPQLSPERLLRPALLELSKKLVFYLNHIANMDRQRKGLGERTSGRDYAYIAFESKDLKSFTDDEVRASIWGACHKYDQSKRRYLRLRERLGFRDGLEAKIEDSIREKTIEETNDRLDAVHSGEPVRENSHDVAARWGCTLRSDIGQHGSACHKALHPYAATVDVGMGVDASSYLDYSGAQNTRLAGYAEDRNRTRTHFMSLRGLRKGNLQEESGKGEGRKDFDGEDSEELGDPNDRDYEE